MPLPDHVPTRRSGLRRTVGTVLGVAGLGVLYVVPLIGRLVVDDAAPSIVSRTHHPRAWREGVREARDAARAPHPHYPLILWHRGTLTALRGRFHTLTEHRTLPVSLSRGGFAYEGARAVDWLLDGLLPMERRQEIRAEWDALIPTQSELRSVFNEPMAAPAGVTVSGWAPLRLEAPTPGPLVPMSGLSGLARLDDRHRLAMRTQPNGETSYFLFEDWQSHPLRMTHSGDVFVHAATGRLLLRDAASKRVLVLHFPSLTILLDQWRE